ncbi:MAG: mannose-1-phosphate guanyltransferase [Fimbriimonadia bacterium]|nr:mannose-1-phosphate guanyltransferase [Fimbriimonadia bacterium]
MKAVVMAGGEGTRLRPITANRPKPLVPIANRPIMEHIVLLLKHQGVQEIVVTLHYLADEIQGYFGDGSDWGVKMHYSLEDTPLGTAGSVKQAEEHLKDGSFLIISGDALTDVDLEPAIQFHKERGSLATLILARVHNPLEFGVVITSEDGRILRFLEKPSWSEVFSDTVNTGMYILEPEIFDYMEPNKPYDFSQDLFPLLLREGKPMYGYVMHEYWSDVGSLQQYRDAQEDLLMGKVELPTPGIEQSPGVWVEAGTQISPEAQIVAPVCIGRNCKIKAGAVVGPYTVLGDNCIVEPNAVISRSVAWDSVYVGTGSSVQSAIVGSRVTVKDDVQIQEDAVIGDRCQIEDNSIIRPRIKLWPEKFIESGSIVTMSLIWGAKWRGSLFRNLGVAGLSNIEVTPELATKLGAAYGSTLQRGATIVLARDTFKVSRMIKHAFMSGVLSTGVDVLDLRAMPLPITRHTIRTTSAVGGVNVRISPTNTRITLMEFFDKRGIYLAKGAERKVENLFFREDFARCDPDEVGVIDFGSRAIEQYQHDFFHLVPPRAGGRNLRLVADFAYSRVAALYPGMLGQMGHEVISLNAYPDATKAPRTPADHDAFAGNLRQIVQTLNADCGVLFENEGERLTVVDERGRLIYGSELLATFALLVAKVYPECMIALPVTAPAVLETMLEPYKVKVKRTKTDTRALMTTAAENATELMMAGDTNGGIIFPAFHPGFDAMFAFLKVLELTEKAGCTLSEIHDQVPAFHMEYRAVRCPWELKGRIMRQFSEEASEDARVEMIDGIKIYKDASWVLILPDSSEPMFHLYVEAPSQEEAQKLLDEYSRRIEGIK